MKIAFFLLPCRQDSTLAASQNLYLRFRCVQWRIVAIVCRPHHRDEAGAGASHPVGPSLQTQVRLPQAQQGMLHTIIVTELRIGDGETGDWSEHPDRSISGRVALGGIVGEMPIRAPSWQRYTYRGLSSSSSFHVTFLWNLTAAIVSRTVGVHLTPAMTAHSQHAEEFSSPPLLHVEPAPPGPWPGLLALDSLPIALQHASANP